MSPGLKNESLRKAVVTYLCKQMGKGQVRPVVTSTSLDIVDFPTLSFHLTFLFAEINVRRAASCE